MSNNIDREERRTVGIDRNEMHSRNHIFLVVSDDPRLSTGCVYVAGTMPSNKDGKALFDFLRSGQASELTACMAYRVQSSKRRRIISLASAERKG